VAESPWIDPGDDCTVKGGDQGRVFWNQEVVGF
jgi:hypothetical protein